MTVDLQVLMPMGGLGSRFVAAGETTPKPLIDIDGEPMFRRALQSFPPEVRVRSLFVVRRDQEDAYGVCAGIRASRPDAEFAILDHDTRGPVETCLEIADRIDPDIPITVADCDIFFRSRAYFENILNLHRRPFDGMLLTFESRDPRYSYVELNPAGEAVRTAEKVVISDHALLGGYFFRSGGLFLDLAREFIGELLPAGLKEYYLSHLFNMLLARDGRVRVASVDSMHIFGTPEELAAYRALPAAERL